MEGPASMLIALGLFGHYSLLAGRADRKARVGFVLIMIGLAMRSILYARRRFLAAGMEEYANMATGFGIAFVGYLLAALFVHAAYPRYFYLLIGIAFALPNLILEPVEEKQPLPSETAELYDNV